MVPPLCLIEELIQTKELVTTQERQIHAMSQSQDAMAQTLQQILECVQHESPISTPAVNNVQLAGKLRYSVYETWHKSQRMSLKQLFVDWFIYELPAGYEDDISKSASLSGTTKSAFK